MSDPVTRIAMWSGPRNLSSAMMRSWGQRPDTVVLDEPLYATYLAETGLDHPGAAQIIAAGPAGWDEAVARCLAPLSDGHTVSYQKQMAHHLLPGHDTSWLDGIRHGLLLRDPRRVLASYTEVRAEVTLADIGLAQQRELLPRCAVVVDAADFLSAPAAYLRAVCDAFEVPYDPRMLSWPAGRRPTDGVWADHWYASVDASTGFGPPPQDTPAELPPHLRPLAAEATAIYEELRGHALAPNELW